MSGTPFLPQFGMAIVDANGKATMQLQQFFMRLAKGSGAVTVTVNGQASSAQTISFGDGFSSTFSSTALTVSTGLDVVDSAGHSYQSTNKLTFGPGFEVSESGGSVVVSGGGTALKIMQNGVEISEGVDLLNFNGNVKADLIGGEVYIQVGGVQANGDGGSYGNLVSGLGVTLTGDTAGDLTISAPGGIEYGGTLYSTIAAGSGVTITPSSNTLTVSASGGGGGGSSPYTVPMMSGFTLKTANAGCTQTDTSTGLALYSPVNGLVLQALSINATIGSTFRATVGFRSNLQGNSFCGLYVGDAASHQITFGVDPAGANYLNVNTWTSYAFTGNPTDTDASQRTGFIEVYCDGTNLNVFVGSDLNNLLPIGVYPIASYLTGAPDEVGLYIGGYTGIAAATFFHFTLI